MKDCLATPVLEPHSDVTATGFTAKWNKVQYANLYEVELIKVEKVKENQGEVYTLLTEDFLGCTAGSKDITDELDNYTLYSGWSGFNLWSESGVLRIGSRDEHGELFTPYFATPADGDITVCFSAKKCSATDGPVTVELHSEFKDCDAEDYDTFEIGNNWDTYWYTFTKDGSQASLFFTTESNGALRVLIDDIIVIQESTELEVSVASYETTQQAYTFSGLAEGKYRYRVRAKDTADAGITSVYSPKAEIVLGGNTGISSPDDSADTVIEVYSLSGVSIYKGVESELPRLAPGVYVVRRNGKSEKVIIK